MVATIIILIILLILSILFGFFAIEFTAMAIAAVWENTSTVKKDLLKYMESKSIYKKIVEQVKKQEIAESETNE